MKSDLKKSNECIERVAACDALERSLTADVMRSRERGQPGSRLARDHMGCRADGSRCRVHRRGCN